MTSLSGSTTVPLPVRFELNRYVTNETVKRKDEAARQRAAKRRAQQEVETLALEYAKIMLERTIYAALDPATDPALAAKLRNTVLDRGIGRVKTQEDDEDAKKKGGGAIEFLETLAAISVAASAIERTQPSARIERDIGGNGVDENLQQLLDDIKGEGDAQ